MRLCYFCATDLKGAEGTCPRCGRAVAPVEDLAAELPPVPLPTSPNWLRWRGVPAVQSVWLERGVEIGFVVGAAVCFLGGLRRVLQGGNITGGLVAMATSPLAGLFVGLVLGAAAHIVQASWAWLVGTPDASRLQAHETLSMTDSLAAPTSTTVISTAASDAPGIMKSPDDLPYTRTHPCEPPPFPSAR